MTHDDEKKGLSVRMSVQDRKLLVEFSDSVGYMRMTRSQVLAYINNMEHFLDELDDELNEELEVRLPPKLSLVQQDIDEDLKSRLRDIKWSD